MRKKGLIALIPAALAALAVIGGTWAAWWTQYQQAGNEYQIAKYSTKLVEEFEKPDDWEPGEEVKKAVWVTNEGNEEGDSITGRIPVLAKIEISQRWIRQENVYRESLDNGVVTKTPVEPLAGEPLPLIFDAGSSNGGRQFAALMNLNKNDVFVLASGRASEEHLRLDINSVNSVEEARGKWLLADETPNLTGNYVFYYIGVLQPGESTPHLLESVTMNPLLENTITGCQTYYEKREDGYHKISLETVNSKYGYDNCRYTLDVKATTVQSMKDAVDKVFGSNSIDRVVVSYLEDYVAGSGVFEADLDKRLRFEEQNGKMVYTPYRNEDGKEDGNWFMSFTDMMPGAIYRDKLNIENASRKDWNLYMQVLPRVDDPEQTALKNELLELIHMTVWQNGVKLYEGNATGASVVSDEGIQRLVYLGRYNAGRNGQITVELGIDKDMLLDDNETGHCKYADLLTKIDWAFMVTEVSTPPDGNNPPGGGRRPSRDPGGNPPTPGNPTTPPTTIDDDGTPLANDTPDIIDDEPVPLSELTVLDDQPIPLAMIPKTGDTTPWIPLLVTFVISGMLMAGMLVARRKGKEE